ncbi:MAG: hydrogenase expression/formation protein HypE [Verrucomicrobiota bacterium]
MSTDPQRIVLLSHGGGGRRTKQLLKEVVLPSIMNPILARLDDGACLSVPESDLVLTTDSYVVRPIFFPGGDIGKLAVCGTINDLAMQGGEPRYLSLALILEEGLPLEDLQKIIASVGKTAGEAGVKIVTGDTKVVERGSGGGIYINTAGLGVRKPGVDTHVANAKPGDAVIVTGTIGDHGIAVMSAREGLAFESKLVSDVAPLWNMVQALLGAVPSIHCLRDPTRGGLASALNDIAEASSVGIRLKESALRVKNEVRGACGLLGLDPLNVANEGKAVVVCARQDSTRTLAVLRSHPLGLEASVVGEVVERHAGQVVLETAIGGERIVDVPSGEDLPRIC